MVLPIIGVAVEEELLIAVHFLLVQEELAEVVLAGKIIAELPHLVVLV